MDVSLPNMLSSSFGFLPGQSWLVPVPTSSDLVSHTPPTLVTLYSLTQTSVSVALISLTLLEQVRTPTFPSVFGNPAEARVGGAESRAKKLGRPGPVSRL